MSNASIINEIEPNVEEQPTLTQHSVAQQKFKECSICLDEVSSLLNKIVTECGHIFHTACLLKNVSINGFNCPYCRNELVKKPKSVVSISSESSFEEDYLRTAYTSRNNLPRYNGRWFERRGLRSLRWFTQRLEGEEPDTDSDSDSDSDSDNDDDEDINQIHENFILNSEGLRLPTPKYIMEKLQEKNISVESLITSIIIADHTDIYHTNRTTFNSLETSSNRVYGAIRSIIHRFRT